MRKRLFYWFASVLLVISVVLVVWQGSFRLSNFGPSNAGQTFIFWAISTLIFILMVTVGWILAREFIKLYVARQAKRLGSRIRTKLVVGAMLLSCVPVFFLVLWSYEVLNYNLKAWFTNPVDNQVEVYDPSPGAARRLVTSGAVGPVGSGATASVTPVKPTAASIQDLRALAASSGHAIYWAGKQSGTTYELSELSGGGTLKRAHSPRLFRLVCRPLPMMTWSRRVTCSIARNTCLAQAARSIAPPMPPPFCPAIFQLAKSPLAATSRPPSWSTRPPSRPKASPGSAASVNCSSVSKRAAAAAIRLKSPASWSVRTVRCSCSGGPNWAGSTKVFPAIRASAGRRQSRWH
jgi:hypothetical protein